MIQNDQVTYLTNQGCEDTTHVSEQRLKDLGLGVGRFEDDPYPLTDEEAQFIGEDAILIAGIWTLIGYSVLIGNQKYLAPTLEIFYDHDDDSPFGFSFEQARAANDERRVIVERLAELTGGYFCWNAEPAMEFSNGDGKFIIELYVPFEYALEHAENFDQWKAHLEKIGRVALQALAA
jgi:hypothetical protein